MSPRRLEAELKSGHRQVGSGARNTTKQPTVAWNRKTGETRIRRCWLWRMTNGKGGAVCSRC